MAVLATAVLVLVRLLLNLAALLAVVLVGTLLFFWTLGKLSHNRHNRNRNHARHWDLNRADENNHHDVHYYDQQQHPSLSQSHPQQYSPHPSTAIPTPHVPPRRLSFSAALTPTSSTSSSQSSRGAPAPAIQAPASAPAQAQAQAPVQGRSSLSSSCYTPRRVTFSLTPEQQQNEYDKRFQYHLQHRRPPSLVSPARPTTPLIELFSSSPMPPTPAFPPRRSTPHHRDHHRPHQFHPQFQQSPTTRRPPPLRFPPT